MSKVIEGNSWPIKEAKRILARINHVTPEKGFVLFETGYGPSGLPHIGTFGEVARTKMVQHAFNNICDIPTKLIAFSDDMDGLRKIPENVPNREMLKEFLGKSLTSIPDPFNKYESYAHHMNAKLRSFLDKFEFEYEFMSATECYRSGMFDQILLKALKHFDQFLEIMLPTLGEERKATYSPFLPICPKTGKVLQVPIIKKDIDKGTITYIDPEDKEEITVPVTGGKCKMQWKADWALRWCAMDVDYEMHGKDLVPTAELSSKLCQVMGYKSPELFMYELFLDQNGKKISKSIGNGISIEEWLKYAPRESLELFMYQAPKKAKRLYFDIIPKNVDDYVTFNVKYHSKSEIDYDNPIYYIHKGKVPKVENYGINYNLLLNLSSVCNPDDKSVLWGFIKKYAPQASPESAVLLDRLVDYSISYYNDFIKPNKSYKSPTVEDIKLLELIETKLKELPKDTSPENIQNIFYDVGKTSSIYSDLKSFFSAIYQILLGQKEGPRLGSFIALYGIENTINLIKNAKSRGSYL